MVKYLSLVGNQVMAVLSPLLAIAEQASPPEEIHLFVTEFSEKKLEKAMNNLRSIGMFQRSNIYQKKISTSLTHNSGDVPPAADLVAEIVSCSNDDDIIFFNLAGGLKYAMVSCLQRLTSLDHSAALNCIYLYPEMNLTHVFQMKNGSISRHDTCPLPAPRNVLQLQDVPVQVLNRGGLRKYAIGKKILKAAKEEKIELPDKYLAQVGIRGLEFDLVWNSQNTLNFLKIVNRSDTARELIGLAFDREAFGQLYHLNIMVLTCTDSVVEKIDREDRGRIRTYSYVRDDVSSLGKALRDAFSAAKVAPSKPVRSRPMQIITGKKTNNDTMLVLVLGQEIMPSLIALWSHRPKTAVFLYTPDNQNIVTTKDMLCSHRKLLPVEELLFHPISLIGQDILDLQLPRSGKQVVNITPGTKSQSAFLTFWGLRHDVRIYSLHSSRGKLEKIPDGKSSNLSAPSPETFLKFTGNKIGDKGENKGSLNKARRVFEGIASFIKMVCGDKDKFAAFPRQNISCEGAEYKRLPNHEGEIRFHNSESSIRFDLKNNTWFERLVGFRLGQCGAQDVQVRLRTAWNQKTLSELRERHGYVSHMGDFDVIARKGCHYYLVECKSTIKKSVADTTSKVNDAAGVLGRFVVPLVCFLKYDGVPYRHKNGVYIFGHKTLLDKKDMGELLKNSLGKWQTTN